MRDLTCSYTNRPSLVCRCGPLPGFVDHEIVLVISEISAKRQKPVKRKIHPWKKADLDAVKNEIVVFNVQFHARFSTESSIEAMWGSVKSKLLEVMDSLVPSKIATTRHNQPWITREVKRLSGQKAASIHESQNVRS